MLPYLLSLCDGLGFVGSVCTPCPHPPAYTYYRCGGWRGVGYSDGQLKPHVMEMALGEHKVIDLTFKKIKSDANISQYGEIDSPSSKRYFYFLKVILLK